VEFEYGSEDGNVVATAERGGAGWWGWRENVEWVRRYDL